MKLGKFVKQPGEREAYAIEYDADMPDDDTLLSAALAIVPASGLTLTSTILTPTRLQLWASGGVDGVTYQITVTATTTNGRILQDEVLLKIKDI